MARVSVGLKFDKKALKALIRYFKTLKSDKFPLEIKRGYEHSNNLQELEEQAKAIIQELIYDAYPDPGTRTYDLLNSIIAIAGGRSADSKTAQINLLSDPDVASAKYYPELSYAAFFEKPGEYHTFIHPRGIPSKPDNFRPFYEVWQVMVQKYSEDLALAAISSALSKLMPQVLKSPTGSLP